MAGSDPTAAYRKQQGLAPITQSYDPNLVAMVVKAAKATGADPKALLATAIQESGARFGAVGDGGTSYGPFQFHKGGALGTHDSTWANSYEAVLNRAQEFKRLGVHHGKGAAAVQRPADQTLYAQGVDSHSSQAASILAKYGISGSPDVTTNPTVPAKGTVAAPNASLAPSNGSTPVQAQQAQRASQLALIGGLFNRPGVKSPGLDVLAAFQAEGKSTSQLTGAGPNEAPGVSIPLKPTGDPTNPATPSTGGSDPTSLAKQVAGPKAAKVVGLAQQYLGTPYKWGGADPKNGFDCSGFVQYLYGKNGVSIPRTTFEQVKSGVAVDRGSLSPGDLVFFNTEGKNSHEGMYIGGGKFIHSPHTGDVVKISNLNDAYYAKHFSTARRVTGGANAK